MNPVCNMYVLSIASSDSNVRQRIRPGPSARIVAKKKTNFIEELQSDPGPNVAARILSARYN